MADVTVTQNPDSTQVPTFKLIKIQIDEWVVLYGPELITTLYGDRAAAWAQYTEIKDAFTGLYGEFYKCPPDQLPDHYWLNGPETLVEA
jgi:hypothetical protein